MALFLLWRENCICIHFSLAVGLRTTLYRVLTYTIQCWLSYTVIRQTVTDVMLLYVKYDKEHRKRNISKLQKCPIIIISLLIFRHNTWFCFSNIIVILSESELSLKGI